MTPQQLKMLASLLASYERYPGRSYRYPEELAALTATVRADAAAHPDALRAGPRQARLASAGRRQRWPAHPARHLP